MNKLSIPRHQQQQYQEQQQTYPEPSEYQESEEQKTPHPNLKFSGGTAKWTGGLK